MKLKYKFVIRNVDNNAVAVAVGEDNSKFNGMVKLNETGEFIFKLLEKEITEEEIISKVVESFETSEVDVRSSVLTYIEYLRKNDLIQE